jgi:hypothetical protein
MAWVDEGVRQQRGELKWGKLSLRIIGMSTTSVQDREPMDLAGLDRALADIISEVDEIREGMKRDDDRIATQKAEIARLKAETRALLSQMNLSIGS